MVKGGKGRQNQERTRILLHFVQVTEERDGLKSLAQTHLVCQDSVGFDPAKVGHPHQALNLIKFRSGNKLKTFLLAFTIQVLIYHRSVGFQNKSHNQGVLVVFDVVLILQNSASSVDDSLVALYALFVPLLVTMVTSPFISTI